MNHILVERRIFFYTISSMNFILFTNIHFFFSRERKPKYFFFFLFNKIQKTVNHLYKKKKKEKQAKIFVHKNLVTIIIC